MIRTYLLPAAPIAAILALGAAIPTPRAPVPWGAHGHRMAAEAAGRGLPESVPAFFRQRTAQLVYLSPEPDRWRAGDMTAMDRAFAYDHYIDLERVPDGALDVQHRWAFLERLHRAGIEDPARNVGFLPFRIVELHQRLVTGWRRWRAATDPGERRWIEDRIIDDAGILGHYVTDASQPHHTTIHFNGWDADAPNPEGFLLDRGFHARFESAFVDAHVELGDLLGRMDGRGPRHLADVRAATLEHVLLSHREVPRLYRLDRDLRFDPDRRHPRTVEFAVERLVSGAEMLQDLWWTAWVESGR